MKAYEEQTSHIARLPSSFRAKLRKLVDERIEHGKNGVDRKDFKARPQKESDIVYCNYHMSDEIFELGCSIYEKQLPLSPEKWREWMMNSRIVKKKHLDTGKDIVVIYHLSHFFSQWAEKELRRIILRFYNFQEQKYPEPNQLFFMIDENLKDDFYI